MRLCATISLLSALLAFATPAGADHAPLNPDGYKWKNAAGADFDLEITWTNGYVAQGAAFQERVRDVVGQDPSCFAGSCTATSWSHWYLDHAHPFFGGAESTVADFDPNDPNGTTACGTLGAVSFHWLAPSITPPPLGETHFCTYTSDPTRVFSAQVLINPSPPAPGSLDAAALACTPGTWTWHTGPVTTDAPRCRTYDLMSVVAHEVGHVVGLGDFRTDASGTNSIDPVCLNGSETEDPRLGNNTNRETMCIPIFSGTERQRTPEEHEKESFANLYPPTGPAPTIGPAAQAVDPTTGRATWTVVVPGDPARATSIHMIYGDGTFDTRAVPQGSGSSTFSITHPFGASGTFTQRVTIVETGATARAVTQQGYALVSGPDNFVGYMQVRGSGSINTVTVTGLDTYGSSAGLMQQTVSSAVASAPTNGSFRVYTNGVNTTNKYLRAGTYDVLVKNGGSSAEYGYSNHSTWNVPGGECGGVTTFKVGTVTYNAGTDGVIDSAADLLGNNKYLGSGWAGWFALPVGMRTSPGSYEQAVCLVDSGGVNGNMAPLDIT